MLMSCVIYFDLYFLLPWFRELNYCSIFHVFENPIQLAKIGISILLTADICHWKAVLILRPLDEIKGGGGTRNGGILIAH